MGVGNKRVVIIGAGPAGAIALETFLNQGYKNVTVIERRSVVGGTWNLDQHIGCTHDTGVPVASTSAPQIPENVGDGTREAPITSGPAPEPALKHHGSLYPQVETNVTADLMAFNSRPFADIRPADTFERFGIPDAFRSHEVVRQYVVDLVKNNEEHVLFNTALVKAFKKTPSGPWTLILRRGNHWWTETADYLYVSTGRFEVPRIPAIDGLSEAIAHFSDRTIIHTKAFRGPEEFVGKQRVVLVGSSFSSSDVAHIVRDVVSLPIHLSLRSIEGFAIRHFAQPWIVPHPSIQKLRINPDGRRLDAVFADGTELTGIDKLVLGTGYIFSYPFLDEYTRSQGFPIVEADGSQPTNMYWFTWWAADPTLAVSSAITESITWKVMEAQAKASAFLWSGDHSSLPNLEEALKWEADRKASLGSRSFLRWHPHYEVLFEGLARTATGSTQFPDGPPVDYTAYANAVERSLDLKGAYYGRAAQRFVSDHPEWAGQYKSTAAFLKANERAF